LAKTCSLDSCCLISTQWYHFLADLNLWHNPFKLANSFFFILPDFLAWQNDTAFKAHLCMKNTHTPTFQEPHVKNAGRLEPVTVRLDEQIFYSYGEVRYIITHHT
jgi:hypothetical protein